MGASESSERGSQNATADADAALIQERRQKLVDAGVAAAAVVGVGLVAWGLGSVFSSSDDRKKMKAPGQDFRIYRDTFEADPASYFRDLRKK